MEKYILKAVFMLTLISTIFPELTFSRNNKEIFISNSGKPAGKYYFQELNSKEGSVKPDSDDLENITERLFSKSDTGKYYRKFFFNDITGINKRFVDSLLLKLEKDSVLRNFRFHGDSIYKNFGDRLWDRRDNSIEIPNMLKRSFPGTYIERFGLPDRAEAPQKNSQSYIFRNTDKDGITTRLRIDVNDPSKEELEKIKASDEILGVQNLSFTPDFSSGKIILTFTLPDKGSANIKVLDSNMNSVYSDNISRFQGTYIKAVSLPANGKYLLVIRQNNKSFVKRLLKQG
jgi:hypothetical protein